MANYKLPQWDKMSFGDIDIEGSFWSSEEMEHLNATIINTSLALRKCNNQISKLERIKLEKTIEFKQKYRRVYLSVKDFKTETQRKFLAEIELENEEADLLGLEELIGELQRQIYTLRGELDTLKTIAHNMRQEMRL